MKALICDRCGGQINPDTLICPYCDTQYVRTAINPESLMTPNEMREKMGLKPIDEITAYDVFGNKIATFERN